MRISWAFIIVLVATSVGPLGSVPLLGSVVGGSAWAAPPEYSPDPFEDRDFIDPPLILEQAHPTDGRFEIGLLFSASAVDKYNNHTGLALDLSYHFWDTLGIGLTFAVYHGELTSIVKGNGGILYNKVENCRSNGQCNLNPNVPDYKQLTSALSLNMVWAPLYGKISLVSEVDLNLQLYVLAGGGIVGRRFVDATFDNSRPVGYALNGGNFGDGGIFDDLTGHGMVGVGVRVFILDWLNIRADFRTLIYPDEFDFDEDGTKDPYASLAYMAQIGVGFVPFGGGD